MGTTYVLLTAMGFFLISKTLGIVSQIRVLPSATTRAVPTPGATAAPVAASPSLQMEVTVRRMLPSMEPKVIIAPLEKVSLKSRFSLPQEYVPELQRQRIQQEEIQKSKEQQKKDMGQLMTLPFRKMGRGFKGLFSGVRSAWTDMGFGRIRVEGKEYKVNVDRGFAHDGFRTLERLVPIKAKNE